MAVKRICDRCGAEINPQTSATIVVLSDYYGGKRTETELCVSCAFHLKQWLGNKEVKK